MLADKNVKAPTGSGKTRALAFLCIINIINGTYITVLGGATNEQCDNLYAYIGVILEDNDKHILNHITRAYGTNGKAQIDIATYVTITNFFHITPYLKASLLGVKTPKYLKDIKNNKNTLFIDEYQLFYKGLTILLQSKGYCSKRLSWKSKFEFKIIADYNINLTDYFNVSTERFVKDVEYCPLLSTRVNKFNKDLREICTNTNTFGLADKVELKYKLKDLSLESKVTSYKYSKGSKNINHEYRLYKIATDEAMFTFINQLECNSVDTTYLKTHIDKIYIFKDFLNVKKTLTEIAEFLIIVFKEEAIFNKAVKITATPPREYESIFNIIKTPPKTKKVVVDLIDYDVKLNVVDKPFMQLIDTLNSNKDYYLSNSLVVLSGSMNQIEEYARQKSLALNYRKKVDYFYNNTKEFKGIVDTVSSSSHLLIGSNLQEYDNLILTDIENTPRPLLMLNDDKSLIYSKITQIFGRINRGTTKEITRLFLNRKLLLRLISYEINYNEDNAPPKEYSLLLKQYQQNYKDEPNELNYYRYALANTVCIAHFKCMNVKHLLKKALQDVCREDIDINFNSHNLEDVCNGIYDNYTPFQLLDDDLKNIYYGNVTRLDKKMITKLDSFNNLIN